MPAHARELEDPAAALGPVAEDTGEVAPVRGRCPRGRTFHAQQAVEKLLKAVLSHHGVTYGRTHDLGRLVELVESSGLPLRPSLRR